MTRSYLVAKKADDLYQGDKFAGWSLELLYGNHKQTYPAKLITFVGRKKDKKLFKFADGSELVLHPDMIVAVEVLA